MTSSYPLSLPSVLAKAVRNNHVPQDDAPDDSASLSLETRESLLQALAETDAAIRHVDDRLSQVFFRNTTFSRETEGLRNLKSGVEWFVQVRDQAAENGRVALVFSFRTLLIETARKEYVARDGEMDSLLSTKNTTTATLVLLNALHTTFTLSARTEQELVSGAVDVAFENLQSLEATLNDLREKNASLSILKSLDERVGVLRDVLSIETEKIWSRLVMFSEEGDIQLSIRKQYIRISSDITQSGPPTTLSIAAVVELLQSLHLLESTMKSLTSLLSRAFLDHLLQNPVGWQFLYRKQDPIAPSITMQPTNLVLADVAPHGHRIFAYLRCITDFLQSNLPPVALTTLIPLLLPLITTRLVPSLDKYIPRSLDGTRDFETMVHAAQEFEVHLQAMEWTHSNTLHDWASRAGETWGKYHSIDILDQVRTTLRRDITSTTGLASIGAVTYQDEANDWSWDDDFVSPEPKRRIPRAQGTTETKIYQCTSLAAFFLTILGTLLQEYTHLPSLPLLYNAQCIYPTLLRDLFALFRATAALHAGNTDETPMRLVNDCFYLAGEIGLMALGMGQVGLKDITAILEEISASMDLCGISWRDRYLENIQVGLIQRVNAAQGFRGAADHEKRARYTVIINGLIQSLETLSTTWKRVLTPDETCNVLGPLITTVLAQITDDILLLPTLNQLDSSALAILFTPLLSLDSLFPRNRTTEFIPQWQRYRFIPQLLDLDAIGILALWRNGRLRAAGWQPEDVIEIVDRRFGRNAEGVIREIRGWFSGGLRLREQGGFEHGLSKIGGRGISSVS